MSISDHLTKEEALLGTKAPQELIDHLSLIDLPYLGYDGKLHLGQMVVAKDLAEEIIMIFLILHKNDFPVERMIPMVQYQWDDQAAMLSNNTSCFNYRTIAGENRLSNHAFGRAIDINPKNNPYMNAHGLANPPGITYTPEAKGTIIEGDIVVKTFTAHGWQWGGHWKNERGYVDYQHFEKPEKN